MHPHAYQRDIAAITGALPWSRVDTGNTLWTYNGANASDLPTVYPLGVTLFYSFETAGWPFSYCGIKTERHHATGAGTYQTASNNLTTGMKSRKYIQSAGWSAWKDV